MVVGIHSTIEDLSISLPSSLIHSSEAAKELLLSSKIFGTDL